MRFDTTPRLGIPRPSETLIQAAMRAVPIALTEDALTIRHSIEPWPIEWLVVSVVQRNHPEAAARWAIHNLAQRGMFSVSDDGEIDLSSTDGLWNWWRHGTQDLDSIAAAAAPSEIHPAETHERSTSSPRLDGFTAPPKLSSWSARSRARATNGLLMTSPGIPMTFLDQEALGDKCWNHNSRDYNDTLISSDGLHSDQAMQDHLRFTRDLLALRRAQPALHGNQLNVFHVHNENRVVAFHRWLEGSGQDVVVVVSLNETTWWNYRVGFPFAGGWREAFNSDAYENWVNPWVAGNCGGIVASNTAMHGLPASAQIVIPANSILIFVPH